MNGNSQTYEKVINISNLPKEKLKRGLCVLGYSIFFSVWVFFALKNTEIMIPVIAAGILCTLMLVLITWKYLFVEYEYAIWYGNFELAKIYSKKKRKSLVNADLKELLLVAPANDEYTAKAEHFEIDKKFFAVSDLDDENVWLLVTGDKDRSRNVVFFEADDTMLSILKSSNPSVFIKNPKM